MIDLERVSPEKARQWLTKNASNRKPRIATMKQYADDMKAGNWTRCTAPIAFYENGDLADGQHRLQAVILSGTEQPFYVIRGLSKQDGLNIDTGKARTLVDAGKISGTDSTSRMNWWPASAASSTARAPALTANPIPTRWGLSRSIVLWQIGPSRTGRRGDTSAMPSRWLRWPGRRTTGRAGKSSSALRR